MFAVIRVGSHQYQVTQGDVVTMEKLDGTPGSEVHFGDILLVGDQDTIRSGEAIKGKVIGIIKNQIRGPKIEVLRKKRRKGFTRSLGHRQPYTEIEIQRIEA